MQIKAILTIIAILTLKTFQTKIPTVLQSMFAKKTPLITWENDINWEKRFFELKNAQNVTLRYFDLLIDTYSSELMNSCIVIFKKDWEVKEIILKKKMDDLILYFENKKKDESFNKKDKEYKENKKNYKQLGGELQKAFSEFQILTGFCYNYFLYLKNFSFLTKYFFDSKYNLVYFKLHLSDKKIKNMEIFKFFIEKLTGFVDNGFFEKVDEDHQKIFYIIYNHFMSDEELRTKYEKIKEL